MRGCECALPRYDGLTFLPFAELLARYAPERTRRAASPDRWRTRVTWRGSTSEEGIRPDRIFALTATGRPAPDCYFLENDEGTETIEPSLTRQRAGDLLPAELDLAKIRALCRDLPQSHP